MATNLQQRRHVVESTTISRHVKLFQPQCIKRILDIDLRMIIAFSTTTFLGSPDMGRNRNGCVIAVH